MACSPCVFSQIEGAKGALFSKNEKTKPQSPDYGGEITINGASFWLSGWNSVSKNGLEYISFAVGAPKGAAPRQE